jgi:nitrogen regulatory protein P-II 1
MKKKITAIIRPEKLEDVKEALDEKGFVAMTITEVKGRGAQKGIRLQYRGKKTEVDLIPKVQIDMVLDENDVLRVISTIKKAGRTGKAGDGKIFVSPIEMIADVRDEEDMVFG